MFSDDSCFISNNGKGIKASEKRVKTSEYIRKIIAINCFLFFQETSFSMGDEKKWKAEFKSLLFSSSMKQINLESWVDPENSGMGTHGGVRWAITYKNHMTSIIIIPNTY